jgi:hypothetical protein
MKKPVRCCPNCGNKISVDKYINGDKPCPHCLNMISSDSIYTTMICIVLTIILLYGIQSNQVLIIIFSFLCLVIYNIYGDKLDGRYMPLVIDND